MPDQAHVTAEVTLENKDVGFVNIAQAAEIKGETPSVHALWHVPATVITITANAVMQDGQVTRDEGGKAKANSPGGEVFPAGHADAEPESHDVDGKAIKLSLGMAVTAEIKTGKRRVIEYLLSRVQSHVRESVDER